MAGCGRALGDLDCVAIVSVGFLLFSLYERGNRNLSSSLPFHSVSFAPVLVCARSKSEKRRLATEAKRDRDMLILGQFNECNASRLRYRYPTPVSI